MSNPSVTMGMRPQPPVAKQQKQAQEAPPKSPLVEFLEASCRGRKLYEFNLTGFKSLGGRDVPRYRCRVLTKTEANRAIVGATRYVDDICSGTSLAKDDPDLLLDAKACWALYEACRDYDRPDVLPAFPSPTWMMDNLSTDQIAVLYNNYILCVGNEGPTVRTITDEMVDDLSTACVATLGTDLPGTALSSLPRESLVEFAIRQAITIAELKLELSNATATGLVGTEEEANGGASGAVESAGGDGEGSEGGSEHLQSGQDVQEHQP